MKLYSILSKVALVIALGLLVLAVTLLLGSYKSMQNWAVLLLIGVGFFAVTGFFFASDELNQPKTNGGH